MDRGTRRFWKTVGRPVDLAGAHAWLRAPISAVAKGTVADTWLAAEVERSGGRVTRDAEAGLLPDIDALAGPGFDPARLHPDVRDFYQRTARWRMEAWVQWTPVFVPGGWLITRYFGRRVGQLALPIRPLDTARGIDSRVETLLDGAGAHLGAAWLRTSRATGEYIYSGFYRTAVLPGSTQPSVHVCFPLPLGTIQVFLRPEPGENGALRLVSPPGPFGADGAYVTVVEGERAWAARLPLHEEFVVYPDGAQLVRTDHTLALGRATVLRLHYLLLPRD
ncbi:hypothetical protein AB0H71_03240 [Nocardia sp. NPDC050697]|uniref:hypothetical protein n=1 Tax=Nocardia sp. NPDC050697 TaxID=3155158 RepID=UPI0033F629BF